MSTTPTAAMLYPGYSAEDEFATLEQLIAAGGGGTVALPVIHTWEGPTAHDVEALLELGSPDHLRPAAAQAAALGAHSVMWACTSGSFVYGTAGVVEQAGWMAEEANLPASSTSLAFVEALRHLDRQHVTVAATYPADVTEHLVRLLTEAGMAVGHATSNDVPSGEAAGDLDPDQVRAMVLTASRAAPDQGSTLIVPDTALHTVTLVEELEAELGRTVLTANQVSAWWGLRLAGWDATAGGLGRLFSRPSPARSAPA